MWHCVEPSASAPERGITLCFAGYSFPDADIHIKYLLKRVQTNRTSSSRLRFTVCNNHPGKKATVAEEEKLRFRRFLGAAVDFTDKSFEDFANDPLKLM